MELEKILFDKDLALWEKGGNIKERRDIAVYKIRMAYLGGQRELSLRSSKGSLALKTLPECIGFLTNIRELSVSSTHLHGFPHSITRLMNQNLKITFS